LYFFLSLLYVAYTLSGFFFRPLLRFVYDETLPIINKSKHPKKGAIQGEKRGRTHIQEDKRTTKRGQTTREHQVPKPPPVTRSISGLFSFSLA
jgi:hypothetical protein